MTWHEQDRYAAATPPGEGGGPKPRPPTPDGTDGAGAIMELCRAAEQVADACRALRDRVLCDRVMSCPYLWVYNGK